MVSKSKVIDACGKAGDTEMALCIFRRMQARGIQPHVVTYSALARPFAYKGHWQEVEDPTAEPQPWHFQFSFDLKLRFSWVKVQLQPQLFKRSVSLQAF
jgi:pentatricopeptide repeat protein